LLYIRPERLHVGPTLAAGQPSNRLALPLHHRSFEGAFLHLVAKAPEGGDVLVQLANIGALPALVPGQVLDLHFTPEDAIVLAERGDHG
jgi:hypothetical protein